VWGVDIKAQDCTSYSIVLLTILVSFYVQKLNRDVNKCYFSILKTFCKLISGVTLKTCTTNFYGGRDSAVCIMTRYGLDGPGLTSRWGRDFLSPSRPAPRPIQPSVQWVPGLFPQEVKRPWRGADHPPPFSDGVEYEWSYTSTSPLVPAWHVTGLLYQHFVLMILMLIRDILKIWRKLFTWIFQAFMQIQLIVNAHWLASLIIEVYVLNITVTYWSHRLNTCGEFTWHYSDFGWKGNKKSK
jgi:hypothetical protein